MHIAHDPLNIVPNSGLAMSEHSNITPEATSMHCQKHSFWQFSRECNTSHCMAFARVLQSFGRCQSSFGKEKTCTNFNQALLHFWQNPGLLLYCHNLPVEHWGSKVKTSSMKDQEQCQATSLQAASFITYTSLPDSNWQGTMQVDAGGIMMVCRLSPHGASKIQPSSNRPFSSHETVTRGIDAGGSGFRETG